MLVRESISKLPAEKEFNNLTLNASEENRCGVIYGMLIFLALAEWLPFLQFPCLLFIPFYEV